MNIAESYELLSHPLYPKIKKVIGRVKSDNLFDHGAGYCWSTSDIIYNLLKEEGVRSHLVEVELTLINTNPTKFNIVGVQNNISSAPDLLATHVVVVIDHDQPLLFDASIKQLLPPPYEYILEFTNGRDNTICESKHGTHTAIYRKKNKIKVPALHQQNILERIATDRLIQKSIQKNSFFIKINIVILFLISCISIFNIMHSLQLESYASSNRQNIVEIKNSIERQDLRMTTISERLNTHTQRLNDLDSRINKLENK